MAVVLRSNSDLVYLPDHGYVGDDGGESQWILLGPADHLSLCSLLSITSRPLFCHDLRIDT